MVTALVLTVAVVVFRLGAALSGAEVAGAVANFSPVGALVLCAAIFFPQRWAAVIPFATLVLSDLILNLHYGHPPLTLYSVVLVVTFGVIFMGGKRLRGLARLDAKCGVPVTMGAAVLSSLFFSLATNTFAFAVSPVYPPSVAGWWQCLTTGTPGFPPTYLFLRNTLVGDLFFTCLFLLADLS